MFNSGPKMWARADPRMQGRVDDSETEWDEAQRRIGNRAPKELEITQDDLLALAEEAIERFDPLEHKTLDELDELEEEVGDDVLRECALGPGGAVLGHLC